MDNRGNVLCKDLPDIATKTCATGFYLKGLKEDGSPECAPDVGVYNFQCDPDEFLYKANGDGTYECKSYNSTDTFVSNQVCNGSNNNVLTGFSNGNRSCVCLPHCPSPGEICDGIEDTRGDGCGGSCSVIGSLASGNNVDGISCP